MIRNYRKAYYKVKRISEQGKAILWGAEVYHSFNCGKFVQDGEDYYLFFCIFVREELPDTQGLNQESLDMDMATSDRLSKHPFWQMICAEQEITPEMLDIVEPPLSGPVKVKIRALHEAGVSDMDIFMLGIYCMVEEFMGFTLDEVQAMHPGIFTITEGAEGELLHNLKPNSLEA